MSFTETTDSFEQWMLNNLRIREIKQISAFTKYVTKLRLALEDRNAIEAANLLKDMARSSLLLGFHKGMGICVPYYLQNARINKKRGSLSLDFLVDTQKSPTLSQSPYRVDIIRTPLPTYLSIALYTTDVPPNVIILGNSRNEGVLVEGRKRRNILVTNDCVLLAKGTQSIIDYYLRFLPDHIEQIKNRFKQKEEDDAAINALLDSSSTEPAQNSQVLYGATFPPNPSRN
jgi:hypothetical protein